MRVAILGSGPAGLMSAAAVCHAHDWTSNRYDINIFSANGKSSLYGAQYLHAPIPGFTPGWETKSGSRLVDYRLTGSAEEYRLKVYGPMWDGTVSPEDLSEPHQAWDIRETYECLWEEFYPNVIEVRMDPSGMRNLVKGLTPFGEFDLVINTIPRPALCTEGHQFKAQTIWASGEAPDLGIELDRFKCPEFTVLCNGEEHPSWYRLSNIFGHKTVEWPEHIRPPIQAAQVTKPLKTNCDCWPTVLHVGRYGKWQKGVLTHHAYQEVLEHVKAEA